MNFSEAELEQWLWDHPHQFLGEDGFWIQRQLRVASGILDLFGCSDCQEDGMVCEIVEVKAVPITSAALCQVKRYFNDLEPLFPLIGKACVVLEANVVALGPVPDVILFEAQALDVNVFTIEPSFNVRGRWKFTDDARTSHADANETAVNELVSIIMQVLSDEEIHRDDQV